MEPLPETSSAARMLRFQTDVDLLPDLRSKAVRVRELVPDCVGVSLALLDHDVTLTLVADPAEFLVLDALQYLDDRAAPAPEGLAGEPEDDLLDERRWQRLSREASARGVATTLSMPVYEHERLIGAVSLYAGAPNAFGGQHQDLAEIFGAWADGAVTNADLSFASLEQAAQAPRQVAGDILLEQACEILSRDLGIDMAAARQRLYAVAAREGISPVEVAVTLIRDDL
jgi:GAF domain-containing protein